MNVREIQRNFMIKLRQFVEEPEVESDDVEYYFNRAQEEYTKEQHFIIKDNYRNQRIGDITIQRAIENLRTLIYTTQCIYSETSPTPENAIPSTQIKNGTVVRLDSDLFVDNVYAYYLRSRLIPEEELDSALSCRIIDTNNLSKFTATKFNTPLFREPAILVEGHNLTVIYPDDIELIDGVSKYELTYITFPKPISIRDDETCLLPIHTHNEIIDIAVGLKIEDLGRARNLGIDKDVERPPMNTGE